ncbi:MAG: hypothetical protein JWO61_133 [Candidatus Saccharibacteria bacterium]|nr:hypothetical protein [Candidatus Saccharibacteria bacterium]
MAKRSSTSRKLNVYSNLSHKRRTKKDASARKKAEYLASLPKHPVKRFLYRLHPKRVWGYWFSKKGGIMALKIAGVGILFMVLMVGALFAYYRKDLDQIRPGELAKRVQTTVTRYTDRNDKLLWEDKGDGNYKLVVDGKDINDYMKKATIAIEDKDFYKHKGISIQGLIRATVNNASGGGTQGGSTLTQQLVKQVFFADEAQKRGLNGVPRKIKEVILAIEVERMYNKEQILNLYLNESPYGGRRNGVESGAQTYFGKKAKDLTLPEAALLAAIPQNPAVYNPYNIEGHEALINRQHIVLNNMADQGMITQKQADEAKKVPIIDTLKKETDQYQDIKAPHFVLEVKKQLEEEYGIKTIRSGGLTVKTTLDLDAQTYAEQAVATGAAGLKGVGADNISLSSVDVKTGQVIAMVGSVDYSRDVYGQRNAATSLLEPGSSIKPIADYAALFKQRDGVNYGPGSILKDENIDSIYCGGNSSACKLRNYTGKFYGSIPIRQALAGSLNIPAVKAMQIAGVDLGLSTAHDLGDISYCSDNSEAGLSAAIGGGCTVRQVEHANAYATLARGGVYKPLSYVLEIKNSSGEKLKSWTDSSKQAVDPQVASLLTDILTDANARNITFGAQGRSFGFVVPGVITATKTGTTENGNGQAKDSWMQSYSPAVATSVWSGNHDGSPMISSDNGVVRRVTNDYMEKVHKNVYAPQGKWKSGDGFTLAPGIQKLTINGKSDIWPSWYKKDAGTTAAKVMFDKISKKKATACTPDAAKIEVEVQKTVDPVTKKDIFIAPDGYDANADDDTHKCEDVKPSLGNVTFSGGGNAIHIPVTAGTNALQSIEIKVGDQVVNTGSLSGVSVYDFVYDFKKNTTITITIQDSGLYTFAGTTQYQ